MPLFGHITAPLLRKTIFAVVVVFALIGGFVVIQVAGMNSFLPSCESTVLASAVSPSEKLVAEHVRKVCPDPERTTHTISVGPAVSSVGETYHTYKFAEREGREFGPLDRIPPAVLWWESDDEIRVIYPRGAVHLDRIELADVTVMASKRQRPE